MTTTIQRRGTHPMLIIAALAAAALVPAIPAHAQTTTCNGLPVTISGTTKYGLTSSSSTSVRCRQVGAPVLGVPPFVSGHQDAGDGLLLQPLSRA